MERLRTFLLLLVLGVGGALFLSPGCMTDPVTGKRSFGLVNPTDEQEIADGRRYAAEFTAEYDGSYPDAEVTAYLASIVRRIGAKSHRPDLPWRFTLLNTSEPNAFALPGGEVFMTRGLLTRLDEEAMFAVVMGHEVGHVNHRHSVKAMNDALLVQLGGAVIAGSVEDERDREIASGLAVVGGQLALMRFSRDQELESDQRGVEYAYTAGYDPRRGARVFEEFARMRAESGGGGGSFLDAWMSSHPLDEDRIDHLEAEVARRYPSLRGTAPAPDLVVSTPEYDRLLARVRAAQKQYDELDRARAAAAKALDAGDGAGAQRALRRIETAGRALPTHALFPAVEGALLKALGDRDTARERLQRAARLQPGLFLARLRLAELEADAGRGGPAVEEALAASRLVPTDAPARFALGRGLEVAGRKDDALRSYNEAARLAATGSAVEKQALHSAQRLEQGGR